MMKKLWHFLRTPSRRWSVLALLLVGVGVTLAGTVGLHYGFEKTSSLEFCISCHSMKDTVYPEYKESIHFKNASGVQAVCTDCHQPKDFVGKVARKMEAANDLYQEYIGHSIDTQEKFEDRRLHLAEKVWARMSSQNSKTCKSCHSYDNMDHAKQSPAAALAMTFRSSSRLLSILSILASSFGFASRFDVVDFNTRNTPAGGTRCGSG